MRPVALPLVAALLAAGLPLLLAPPRAGAAEPDRAPAPTFELSLVRGERSKDSNSRTVRVTLVGSEVRFSGPHEPCVRGRCRHSEVRFALTPEQQAELKTVFERYPLPRRFTETKSTDSLGNYAQAEVTRRGGPGGPARVSLAGMTGVYPDPGPEDEVKVLSPDALAVLASVRGIARFFEQAAEPHLAKVPPEAPRRPGPGKETDALAPPAPPAPPALLRPGLPTAAPSCARLASRATAG